MKRFFLVSVILILASFVFSSFILPDFPQDPPGSQKVEKHLKILKVDDQGNRVELDTVISHEGVFVWNGDTVGNHNFVFSEVPNIPVSPVAPRMLFFGQEGNANVIDLKDSGVISFKKKKLSGGREKITIIRNQPDEKNVERVKTIVVTDKGNGKTEVFENESEFQNKGEANIRIIHEDGKNIIIRETRKNNEKEIEVEVEEVIEND